MKKKIERFELIWPWESDDLFLIIDVVKIEIAFQIWPSFRWVVRQKGDQFRKNHSTGVFFNKRFSNPSSPFRVIWIRVPGCKNSSTPLVIVRTPLTDPALFESSLIHISFGFVSRSQFEPRTPEIWPRFFKLFLMRWNMQVWQAFFESEISIFFKNTLSSVLIQ